MDPLEWVHQWDNFEMMMYARSPEEGDAGVFIQVSKRLILQGAEEWEIVYDRKLQDIDVTHENTDVAEWEERVLRDYLTCHPQLVNDEKQFLTDFLQKVQL